jgi:hypothetical protein
MTWLRTRQFPDKQENTENFAICGSKSDGSMPKELHVSASYAEIPDEK